MLAVLCVIASVTTCVRARRKTEKPKIDTSDQGTLMKNSPLKNNHRSMTSEFFIFVFQSCQKSPGSWLWSRKPVVSIIQSRNRAAARSPSARRTLKVNSQCDFETLCRGWENTFSRGAGGIKKSSTLNVRSTFTCRRSCRCAVAQNVDTSSESRRRVVDCVIFGGQSL